jgi:hypothetical protein
MPAKQAMGRQMSPPSALLNSLNELNGTTQRFSTPSQRVHPKYEIVAAERRDKRRRGQRKIDMTTAA